MSGSDPLAAILDWFLEIEQWLPGAHSWAGEIIYGEIPLSDATAVYDLADAWGVLAEQLNEAYEEVLHAADDVLDSWSGDGGAEVFREQWYAYLQALNATAQGAAAMQQGVQQFGMQVELMKFMTALNLLLLAYTLLALIMAALYSFGISLGGAVPAFMTFQTAVSSAAAKTLGAIANIGIRIGIRPLTFALGRAVPAVVRTSIAAGTRAALPAVISRTVPQVVRTGLANVARRAATRGISRSVSSRLASQALRGAASRRLRTELAGEVAEGAARYAGNRAAGRGAAAGARQLGARATLAVQSELAREIQRQMLVRAGGSTAIRATESAAIRQMAAAQVGRIGLGREVAEYVGIRVAFGAGFLGGGNLLGQLGQMAEGNRASLDMGQVVQGTIQGAAFATGMWGGVLGHTAGGAVAGGLVAAAFEGVEYLTAEEGSPEKAFDLTEVGHHALQGAVMGVVAGADVQVSTMRFSGGLRIGDTVHALPSESGGLNVVAAAGDGRVIALGDAGFAYQHPMADGGVQRVLSEGMAREPGVGEVFRALMPDGGGAPPPGPPAVPTRPVDAPAPSRMAQLPAADIPVRDAVTGRPPDGGGGGGGGGGPRQPVSQSPHGPAAPRAPERIPAGELAGPVLERPGPATDGSGPASRGTAAPVLDGPAVRAVGEPMQDGAPPPPSADPPRDGLDGPRPPADPPAAPTTVDPTPPLDGGAVSPRDGAVPYRLVPVDPVPVGPTAPRADAVAAVVDGHVAGLLEGRPPDATPVDQPHRATWNPESGTLSVRFPDGLTVDVVLQVNSSLPAGHPAVVTPPLSQIDGVFRQVEPAGVVVPAHAPADPVARAEFVQRELGSAWSTLHHELMGMPDLRPLGDAPPPQDGSLAALEEGGPGVPVLGPERVTFLDTTPAVPPEPRPLTPEAVRQMLDDPALPEPVAGWVRDNLAVRGEDGRYLPRSAEEIAGVVAQLQAEAARAVAGPEPAAPREVTASSVDRSQFHGYGRPEADPAAVLRTGQDALDGLVNRLPSDAPLRDLRLDVTTVPADSLPQRAVARSVPVDALGNDLPPGTVPPDGGGYRIEVSDRANDPAITRAMVHEVAELSATALRAAEGLELAPPDALRPGEFTDGSPLSPHDLGRLAELEALTGMLADPRYAGYAHAEIGALREHLGLRADEAGAAGRRELADPHLTPEARAALDSMGPPRDGPEAYKLAEPENERIFRDEIVPNWLAGATTQERPVVVFVGGQTGAGKTAITDMIKNALAARGDFINVNMDFYNPHHPSFNRLQAADETTASSYVRPDGEVWWDKAQDHAIANRNDVVLETAMRTPAEFEAIAAKFREAGYRIETAIVAVPEASSRLGVLDRFWGELQENGRGRYVEQAAHDATYNGVIRAASALDATQLSDRVFVFRRGGEVVYSNHLTPDGQWARPPATAEAVQGERTRTWTAAEEQWFISNVERLRNEIDPRWRAEVDEIAELGRPLSPAMQAAEAPRPALPPAPEGGTPARAEAPPPPEAGPPPPEAGPPPADPVLAADPTPVPADPTPAPADPAQVPADPAQVPPADPASGPPASTDVVNALRGEPSGDYLPYDRADLDPNPRPGETPEQAADRVEMAEVAKTYNDLGPEPPRINVAENDAAYGNLGAHTTVRHDPSVPLHRDPNTRTVEGRIYGDPPWPHPENFSYRWLDTSTMNRTINEYLRQNWAAIRDDLALNLRHHMVVDFGHAIGEGFYNRTAYQPGPPAARYHLTSMLDITLHIVRGSDPARFFIITAFPTGRGF